MVPGASLVAYATTWRRRLAGSSAELVGSSAAGGASRAGGSKNGNGPATAAVDHSAASATAVLAAVRAKSGHGVPPVSAHWSLERRKRFNDPPPARARLKP